MTDSPTYALRVLNDKIVVIEERSQNIVYQFDHNGLSASQNITIKGDINIAGSLTGSNLAITTPDYLKTYEFKNYAADCIMAGSGATRQVSTNAVIFPKGGNNAVWNSFYVPERIASFNFRLIVQYSTPAALTGDFIFFYLPRIYNIGRTSASSYVGTGNPPVGLGRKRTAVPSSNDTLAYINLPSWGIKYNSAGGLWVNFAFGRDSDSANDTLQGNIYIYSVSVQFV